MYVEVACTINLYCFCPLFPCLGQKKPLHMRVALLQQALKDKCLLKAFSETGISCITLSVQQLLRYPSAFSFQT